MRPSAQFLFTERLIISHKGARERIKKSQGKPSIEQMHSEQSDFRVQKEGSQGQIPEVWKAIASPLFYLPGIFQEEVAIPPAPD